MPEIFSLSITSESVSACAMSLDAKYRTHDEELIDSSANSLCDSIALCLASLYLEEQPLALVITSNPSALFVTKHGEAVTQIFSDQPLIMPKHDVPSIFAEDYDLAQVYRSSVLRRLQVFQPELGQSEELGISSAAALIIRALTGAHVDAIKPLGVAQTFSTSDPMAWRALGVSQDLSLALVLPNRAIAQINNFDVLPKCAASLEPWRKKFSGVPLFHAGSALASQAYASASNPLCWATSIGWNASAAWNASKSALASYQIQIIDHPSEVINNNINNNIININNNINNINNSEVETPKERTRDEWTQYMSQLLPLNTYAGARRSDNGYVLQTPRFDAEFFVSALRNIESSFASSKPNALDILSCAPLGSAGLHLTPSDAGIRMVGLTSAHTNAHIARAVFESHCYEIKHWRASTKLNGLGAIRASFAKPWDASAAQILCDVLGETTLILEQTPSALSAIGAALATLRDLDIGASGASPKLEAFSLEPTSAATLYAQHFEIHELLRQ